MKNNKEIQKQRGLIQNSIVEENSTRMYLKAADAEGFRPCLSFFQNNALFTFNYIK